MKEIFILFLLASALSLSAQNKIEIKGNPVIEISIIHYGMTSHFESASFVRLHYNNKIIIRGNPILREFVKQINEIEYVEEEKILSSDFLACRIVIDIYENGRISNSIIFNRYNQFIINEFRDKVAVYAAPKDFLCYLLNIVPYEYHRNTYISKCQ